ncbi:MAG: cytochrome c oxidase assembly protein [Arenicellales bacterium]|nr:cytochrome c oxidase assembly protein [Arenicellales bacterium]
MKADSSKANRKIVIRLLVLTVFMFGFGYALVPLYDTFCIAFGLNGKTGVTDNRTAAAKGIDETRWVTVQFTSHTAVGLPWEFKPVQKSIKVRPGQVMDAAYFAKNKTTRPIVGRATYSVAPSQAAVHFKKTECFCFTNQKLLANEEKDMPVRFVIDANLPKEIHTVTLSYSFFNAEKYLSEQEQLKLSEQVEIGAGTEKRI